MRPQRRPVVGPPWWWVVAPLPVARPVLVARGAAVVGRSAPVFWNGWGALPPGGMAASPR